MVSHTVSNLGLAYDHRYVNGRTAAVFLRRIKQRLETWDG
ncbi:2-oxo acid dehydrogenase subunit E2 [Micromonospora sp. NPDC049060]